MSALSAQLQEVRTLISHVKEKDAEDVLLRLINRLPQAELRQEQEQLQQVINEFLRKRKARLTEALAARLRDRPAATVPLSPLKPTPAAAVPPSDPQPAAPRPGPSGPSRVRPPRPPLRRTRPSTAPPALAAAPGPRAAPQVPAPVPAGPVLPPTDPFGDLRQRLADLSANHIFQWSTLYRDLVREVFERALSAVQQAPDDDRSLVNRLEDAFAHHATDIFSKGYDYKTKQGVSHEQAVLISIYGLQRFLDLPLELYANTLANTTEEGVSRAARQVCSALLAGILQGYGHVQLGGEPGWHLLPRYRRSWAHCLAFLCAGHLDQLASPMEAGEFRTGLQDVLLPVLAAIDELRRGAPGGRAHCRAWGSSSGTPGGWRSPWNFPIPWPGAATSTCTATSPMPSCAGTSWRSR